MARLFLMLAAAAIVVAGVAFAVDPADAQLPVTCAGTIQKCPDGKTMYCNRWKACKPKKGKPKVGKYCDAPVCITDKKN